jgi:type II secretory pathway pseudopilin PulG
VIKEFAMMQQRHSPARSAFTVIELLVVIGIIAVIISLTAAAVMAIIRGQEKSTTELTIRRVGESATANARAVFDQAKELQIPASVMNLANGDPRRAKVIWQKLQLKRNFPMTFREAIYPWAIDGNPAAGSVPGLLPPLGTGKASPISPNDLPPLDSYVTAIKGILATLPQPVTTWPFAAPNTFDPDESSHLLLLALSVKRRGVSFNAESALGPGALYVDPQHQIKGFKDAWDQPIVFFRWPTDFPDNLANAGDLQDPEGTLLDANWNNQILYNSTTPIPGRTDFVLGRYGVYWFEQLCHLVHDPTQGAAVWQRAFYSPLAIVSAGPNKRLGFYPTTPPNPPLIGPLYPMNTPNFGMALDRTADSFDNIVSTTLK